jgi:hypothetical protein
MQVSGRTKDGLGVGILNAVTKKTFATIENKDTQETRREEVEPLSNYNVLVLDQRSQKTQLFPLSTLMLLETVVFATETSLL